MGTITLKSKTHIGSGNFEYVYECFCGIPRPTSEIKVVSGNDNQARQMAQNECDEHCDQENNLEIS